MEGMEPQDMSPGPGFDFVRVIGLGSFGVVCEYIDRAQDTHVAIKRLFRVGSSGDLRRLLREVIVLSRFKHPNVLALHKVLLRETPQADVYLVTELMDSDLHSVILKSRRQLQNGHVRYIFYQLFSALQYLHSGGIVHRDVKPSNILINADCSLRLADFGLVRQSAGGVELTEYVVNRCYRAPEVVLCPRDYGEKIDVWAVGCCLFEMLVGEPIFSGSDHLEVLLNVFELLGKPPDTELAFVTTEHGRRFVEGLRSVTPRSASALARAATACLPGVSPHALDLLDECLRISPERRISAAQAIQHAFFAEEFDDKDCRAFEQVLDFGFEGIGEISLTEAKMRIASETELLDGAESCGVLCALHDNRGGRALVRLRPQKSAHKAAQVGPNPAGVFRGSPDRSSGLLHCTR